MYREEKLEANSSIISRNKFTIKVILFVLYIFISGYVVFSVFHPHICRASLISTVEISDKIFFYLAPDRIPIKMNYDDESMLVKFYTELPDLFKKPNFDSAVGILKYVGEFNANKDLKCNELMPEYPDVILDEMKNNNTKGSCYNYMILFNTFVQSIGLKARSLAFQDRDGLGKSVHALSEVWIEEMKKWVLFDAQQAAYFTFKESNIPMSAIEVREAVQKLSKDEFHHKVYVHQFDGYNVPAEEIFEFYKRTSADFMISNFNNYFTASKASIFYKTLKFLSVKKPFGKRTENLSRFLRALIDKSRKNIRLVDNYSPLINYRTWYYLFHILFPIWLIITFSALIYFLHIHLSNQRRRKKAKSFPST